MIGRILAVVPLLAGAAAAQIVLAFPKEYQVFQRQWPRAGMIRVSGNTAVPCDRVEARWGDSTWIPLDWKPPHFEGLVPAANTFAAVQVRLLAADQIVAETSIAHVATGEVFIIAGQSNATNYGEEKQHPKSGMVVSFDGTDWRPADDPQPGVQDSSKNGSFIPAFGDALYEKLHVPVAVACVGHGSTSVRQWMPDGVRFRNQPTMTRFVEPAGNEWQSTGQLFDGLMRRIGQLGPDGFRALLWHQGESDAHQQAGHEISPEEYRTLMEKLIHSSRARAGWDFPWMVAQASYHNPSDPSAPEIRAAQAALWKSGLALEGPDTDQLTGDYRQNNGKGVHFSASGLQAHGRLWAEKVMQAFWPAR